MAINRWTDGGADGDWNNTANWSLGTKPANAEDIYIETSSRAIDTNLGQSGVALASLNISMEFSGAGTLGTKTTALQIGASNVNIGYSRGATVGAGSGRVFLDLGSTTPAIVIVENSKSSATDANQMPVRIKANKSDTDIYVLGGRVGLADQPGETGQWRTVFVEGGIVVIGHPNTPAALTLATLNAQGGVSRIYNTITTINGDGGGVTVLGDAAATTVNQRRSALTWNSLGTLATLNLYAGGDTRILRGAVTNLNWKERGFTYRYDKDEVTVTNFSNDIADEVVATVD